MNLLCIRNKTLPYFMYFSIKRGCSEVLMSDRKNISKKVCYHCNGVFFFLQYITFR